MIENLAKRLKAWGKEIKRGHDAALFEALPQMLKDKIEQEIEEMTKPTTPTLPDMFVVGRPHSRKVGEMIYLYERPRFNDPLQTSGNKENACRYLWAQDAKDDARRAFRKTGVQYYVYSEKTKHIVTATQLETTIKEEAGAYRSASRREAEKAARRNGMTSEEWCARQDEIAERYAKKKEAGDNPMSLEEWQARRDALVEDYDARVRANIKEAAEALSGAKLVNGKELNKALNNNGESVKVNAIVERPAHYNQGSIDVIEALYQLLTWEQFKGFMQGNIIKYSVRFEDKDDPILDLEKAEYYTKRLKEYRKKHHEAELREKEGRA